MGLFKKREMVIDAPADGVSISWPVDTFDEDVDDAAFAAAIEKGRAEEAARSVTVVAA